MFYCNELELFRASLDKIRLHSAVVTLDSPVSEVIDEQMSLLFSSQIELSAPISDFVGNVEEKTIYKMTGALALSYIFLLLPDAPKGTVLFIGPYISRPLTAQRIFEIEEKNSLSPKLHKFVVDFFSSIPVVPSSSHIFLFLDALAERIWNGDTFSVVDVENDRTLPISPISDLSATDDPDGVLLNINIMERRYEYENELIRAVTLGQINKANALLNAFSTMSFEKRISDPIRNFKNYGIIMNTLLRKAAEAGGVHPVYLDSVSSSFAAKIEQTSSVTDGNALMHEMFRSYCRLVRKHSMKDYSPIVQKSIIFIDSNLSSSLSLSTIADAQNVSAGYLSTIFKRETGKTITEYIAERRVKHASHLLSTTHLQIQTIALHCGIMDVQYFSKVFKKLTGKTPKEYRDSLKQ